MEVSGSVVVGLLVETVAFESCFLIVSLPGLIVEARLGSSLTRTLDLKSVRTRLWGLQQSPRSCILTTCSVMPCIYEVKARSRLIESVIPANHLATDETLRDCVVSCNELSSYRDMIRDQKATPSSIWLSGKALPKYQHSHCAMLSAVLPLSTGTALQSPEIWPMPVFVDRTLHTRFLCICSRLVV